MVKVDCRPCVPEDVDKAVPLIFESGPPSFNYVFTNKQLTAIDFLTYAFQRKGGEFSFDNHIAILLDQELIGVGAAFSAKRAKGFMFTDILNILRCYRFRALPVLIKGLRIEQKLKLPKGDEICLAHIAIAENKRSRGFGQQLVQFLMENADKDPSSYFVLDVSEENPRAQQLYERIGFTVTKHIRSTYKSRYGYVPNFFRMELK